MYCDRIRYRSAPNHWRRGCFVRERLQINAADPVSTACADRTPVWVIESSVVAVS